MSILYSSHLGQLVFACTKFFFTFSAEEVSDGENIDDDGDDVDIRDIFDDLAVEEQLRQHGVGHEHELQEQGETFTVTANVHITPVTEHADVVSSSLQIRFTVFGPNQN